MVEVFGLVRELLAEDGVLWLNLGDSYAGGGTIGRNDAGRNFTGGGGNKEGSGNPGAQGWRQPAPGLKPKDLIGIPWRVAFALQEAGWYLRQDIIWAKPNPMPESVTDRCTKAHEYVFLMSKSARYYFDHASIQEPETMKPQNRLTPRKDNPAAKVHGMPIYRQAEGGTGGGMRNRRSVWTVPTMPYSGAHFATFPPALIEPMILAGSRPGDLVLDPFFGSGTTGEVAQRLGRKWVGCELNEAYGELQHWRTAQGGLVF
jgi:site-specific DNA-methyltransferase (cytosine-N4-specific)